jgi:hypothetical protein
MPSVIMLCVIIGFHYDVCHFAERHYTEHHYAECRYAECHCGVVMAPFNFI